MATFQSKNVVLKLGENSLKSYYQTTLIIRGEERHFPDILRP